MTIPAATSRTTYSVRQTAQSDAQYFRAFALSPHSENYFFGIRPSDHAEWAKQMVAPVPNLLRQTILRNNSPAAFFNFLFRKPSEAEVTVGSFEPVATGRGAIYSYIAFRHFFHLSSGRLLANVSYSNHSMLTLARDLGFRERSSRTASSSTSSRVLLYASGIGDMSASIKKFVRRVNIEF
jgi:hypothetical protein